MSQELFWVVGNQQWRKDKVSGLMELVFVCVCWEVNK